MLFSQIIKHAQDTILSVLLDAIFFCFNLIKISKFQIINILNWYKMFLLKKKGTAYFWKIAFHRCSHLVISDIGALIKLIFYLLDIFILYS